MNEPRAQPFVSDVQTPPRRCPYPGLRPFRYDEADLFFGRAEQVAQLVALLAETRFLAVIGPAGVGKSSLVRAGLLPALAAGAPVDPAAAPGTRWAMVHLCPGAHPFHRLSAALLQRGVGPDAPRLPADEAPADPPHIDTLEQELRRVPRSLARLLDRLLVQHPLAPDERLLILVDQFEELFRYHRAEPATAAAFVALLLGLAAHPDCAVAIILSAEFLRDCAPIPGLREAINAGLYLVPRLTPEQLIAAVLRPARRPECGGDLTPGLVQRLLHDANQEPDQLPLLQHLLVRLWDSTPPGPDGTRLLDEAGYERLGGLRRALDDQAEQALAELPDPGQQALAALMWRALTERPADAGETRRPVRIAALAALAQTDPGQVIACAAPFRRADRRFLRPGPDRELTPNDDLDLTQEALIRHWRRLADWTAQEAAQAKLYRRLERAAQRWQSGQPAAWGEADQQAALAWREQARPTAGWAARYGGDFTLAMQYLDAGGPVHAWALDQGHPFDRAVTDLAWPIAAAAVAALVSILALAGWGWHTHRQAAVERQQAAAERHQAAVAAAAARSAQGTRTAGLFDADLTRAALLAQGEDYAGAWRVLGETLPLDGDGIPAARRQVRNLLAGVVDLRRGVADLTYTGVEVPLLALARSPDGRWLVAGGERGTLLVFDAATGVLVRRLAGHDPAAGGSGAVAAVCFDAAGGRLYSGGQDGRIIAWSVPQWASQGTWQAPAEVWSLAASPDGTRLASAGPADGIALWSTKAAGRPRILTGKTSLTAGANTLAWLPDGRLVSGAATGLVGLWTPQTGVERVLPRVHAEAVTSVAASPDGTRIATGGRDQIIALWDPQGQPVRQLHGHRNAVRALAFDPTGRRLLSAGADRDLRLWDLASGTTLRVFQGHTAAPGAVVAAADFAYTAAGDGTARRWPLATPGQWVWDLPGVEPSAVALDPAASLVLVGLADGGLRAYGLPGAEPAPDQPGPVLATVPDAHAGKIKRLAWGPDRRTIASAGTDGLARLWRLEPSPTGLTLTPVQRLAGHTDVVHDVAFSADGDWVATVGYDGQLGLFATATGAGAMSRAVDDGQVLSVAFTPDGTALVTAERDDRRLRRWARDGAHLGASRTIATLADRPMWAALSPDGRQVAAVGRQLVVTRHRANPSADGTGPADPAPLVGHEQTVFRAIYTPNGQVLATVSGDTTLRLWDLGTDQPLARLQLPTPFSNPSALWDFDLRCTADQATCWIAVPLTMGRLALYRLPYAAPPAGLTAPP